MLNKKCKPCTKDTPTLTNDEIEEFFEEIPEWTLEGNKIVRVFTFKNFKESLSFVNKVAELAEEEDHHPDIEIKWNKVKLVLWTHVIKGLSENDFILAKKIDSINSTSF